MEYEVVAEQSVCVSVGRNRGQHKKGVGKLVQGSSVVNVGVSKVLFRASD
jgi:hypothetical protein